jgi:hypothetical protein
MNDINTFQFSPLLESYIGGTIPKCGFYANNNYYEHGYYLADGIYPEYSMLVKTFSQTTDERRQYFKRTHESARKDVERCFGVLQQRWHFVRNPCRVWEKERIRMVMYACIIMHNMILEDEGKAICPNYFAEEDVPGTQATQEERFQNSAMLRSKEIHNALKADLVEEAWSIRPLHHHNQEEEDEEEEEEVGEEEAEEEEEEEEEEGENEEGDDDDE